MQIGAGGASVSVRTDATGGGGEDVGTPYSPYNLQQQQQNRTSHATPVFVGIIIKLSLWLMPKAKACLSGGDTSPCCLPPPPEHGAASFLRAFEDR